MMSGTFVLTDTIDKAFSSIFDDSYAGTDVVVSGKGADISFQGLDAEVPPVDEGLVDEINALPDVEIASGSVVDETNTKIIAPTAGHQHDTARPASASAWRPARRSTASTRSSSSRGHGPRATARS
jgi:hypothetical protein